MRPRSTGASLAAVVIVAGVLAVTGCSGDDEATDASIPSTDGTTTIATGTAESGTTASTSTTTTGARPTGTSTPSDTIAGSTVATVPANPPARIETGLDAAGFADRLSAAHATIVDPGAAPAARDDAGIEYQLVLRAMADRPELDDDVLAALDPAARTTVEPVVRARQFLQQRSASRPPQPLPDELPAWTITEPEPVATLLTHYADAERSTGIPWYWLAAIHLQETRMGRIQGVSTAGAVGPMQFLPTTWAACCTGDPTVTGDAILGAATYLAQSGGPDDMAAAVYQYNPNDGYVAVVRAYAESLRDEPELYTGYHAFQVFFTTSAGTVRLPVGYSQTSPVDVAAYLESNPQDRA
jgi:membrane-bound lytic murein transglycosylase B